MADGTTRTVLAGSIKLDLGQFEEDLKKIPSLLKASTGEIETEISRSTKAIRTELDAVQKAANQLASTLAPVTGTTKSVAESLAKLTSEATKLATATDALSPKLTNASTSFEKAASGAEKLSKTIRDIPRETQAATSGLNTLAASAERVNQRVANAQQKVNQSAGSAGSGATANSTTAGLKSIENAANTTAKAADTAGNKIKQAFSGIDEQGSIRDLDANLKRVERQIYATYRAGAQISQLNFMFTMFGTAALTGMQQLIQSAQGFDIWARKAYAAGKASGEFGPNLEIMKQQLMDLSGEIGSFSVDQVAQGYYFWQSATGQVIETQQELADVLQNQLLPVLKVSAISEVSVGEAVRGVTSTVGEFGYSMDQASRVANVMLAVTQLTNAEFLDMIQAFTYLGSGAATLGMEIEEVAAVMGRLADVNLRGGNAGRALAQVLNAFINPSKAAQGELDALFEGSLKLGNSWRDIIFPGGEFVGLIDQQNEAGETQQGLLSIIADRTRNMASADRLAVIEKLTTMNAFRAFVPLLQQYIEGTEAAEKGTQDLYRQLRENPLQVFNDQWEVISQSIKEQFGRRINELKTTMIEFGYLAAAALLPVLDRLVALTSAAREFAVTNPELLKFALAAFSIATALAVAGATMNVVLGNLIQFIGIIQLLPAAIQRVALGFSSIQAIWIPGILAIVSVVGLLAAAWINNWGGMKDAVKDLAGVIDGLMSELASDVQLVLTFFRALLTFNFEEAGVALREAFLRAAASIIQIIEAIGPAITSLIMGFIHDVDAALSSFGGDAYQIGRAWALNLVDGLRDAIQSQIDSIRGLLEGVLPSTTTSTTEVTGRRTGGMVGDGEVTLVGEEGPEIAIFPKGTFIVPAPATAAIQGRMAEGGTIGASGSSGGGGSFLSDIKSYFMGEGESAGAAFVDGFSNNEIGPNELPFKPGPILTWVQGMGKSVGDAFISGFTAADFGKLESFLDTAFKNFQDQFEDGLFGGGAGAIDQFVSHFVDGLNTIQQMMQAVKAGNPIGADLQGQIQEAFGDLAGDVMAVAEAYGAVARAKSAVAADQEVIDKLTAEKELLNDGKQAIQDQIQSLNDQKEPYQEQLRLIDRAVELLNRQKRQLDLLKEPLEDAKDAIDDTVRGMQRMLEPIEDARYALSLQKEPLEDTIQVIDDIIQSIQDQNEALDRQKWPLEDALEYYDDILRSIQEQKDAIDLLKQPLEDEKQALEDVLDGMNEALEATRLRLEEAKLAQEEELRPMREALDGRKEALELERETEELRREGIQDQLDAQQEVIDGQREALDSEKEALDLRRDAAQEALESSQKALDAQKAELDRTKARFALEEEIAASRTEQAELMGASQNVLSFLRYQEAQLKKSHEGVLAPEEERLNREQELLNERKEQSEAAFDAEQKVIDARDKSIRQQEALLDKEREAEDRRAASFDRAARNTERGIERDQKAIEAKERQYERDNRILEQQIRNQERDIRNQEAKIKAIDKELEVYNRQQELLDRRAKEADKARDAVEREIEAIDRQKRENDRRIAMQELEKQALERELDAIARRETQLGRQESRINREIELENRRKERIDDEIRALDRQAELLDREIRANQDKRNAPEDAIENIDGQIREQEKKSRDLDRQIRDKERTISDKKKEQDANEKILAQETERLKNAEALLAYHQKIKDMIDQIENSGNGQKPVQEGTPKDPNSGSGSPADPRMLEENAAPQSGSPRLRALIAATYLYGKMSEYLTAQLNITRDAQGNLTSMMGISNTMLLLGATHMGTLTTNVLRLGREGLPLLGEAGRVAFTQVSDALTGTRREFDLLHSKAMAGGMTPVQWEVRANIHGWEQVEQELAERGVPRTGEIISSKFKEQVRIAEKIMQDGKEIEKISYQWKVTWGKLASIMVSDAERGAAALAGSFDRAATNIVNEVANGVSRASASFSFTDIARNLISKIGGGLDNASAGLDEYLERLAAGIPEKFAASFGSQEVPMKAAFEQVLVAVVPDTAALEAKLAKYEQVFKGSQTRLNNIAGDYTRSAEIIQNGYNAYLEALTTGNERELVLNQGLINQRTQASQYLQTIEDDLIKALDRADELQTVYENRRIARDRARAELAGLIQDRETASRMLQRAQEDLNRILADKTSTLAAREAGEALLAERERISAELASQMDEMVEKIATATRRFDEAENFLTEADRQVQERLQRGLVRHLNDLYEAQDLLNNNQIRLKTRIDQIVSTVPDTTKAVTDALKTQRTAVLQMRADLLNDIARLDEPVDRLKAKIAEYAADGSFPGLKAEAERKLAALLETQAVERQMVETARENLRQRLIVIESVMDEGPGFLEDKLPNRRLRDTIAKEYQNAIKARDDMRAVLEPMAEMMASLNDQKFAAMQAGDEDLAKAIGENITKLRSEIARLTPAYAEVIKEFERTQERFVFGFKDSNGKTVAGMRTAWAQMEEVGFKMPEIKLTGSEEELAKLRAQLRVTRENIDTTLAELTDVKGQIAAVEAKLKLPSVDPEEVARLEAELADLRSRWETNLNEFGKQQEKLRFIPDFEPQIAQMEQARNRLADQLALIESDIARVQKAANTNIGVAGRAAANQELADLRTLYAETTDLITQFDNQIAESSTKLAAYPAQVAKLQDEYRILFEALYETNGRQVAAAQATAKTAQRNIRTISNEIDNLIKSSQNAYNVVLKPTLVPDEQIAETLYERLDNAIRNAADRLDPRTVFRNASKGFDFFDEVITGGAPINPQAEEWWRRAGRIFTNAKELMFGDLVKAFSLDSIIDQAIKGINVTPGTINVGAALNLGGGVGQGILPGLESMFNVEDAARLGDNFGKSLRLGLANAFTTGGQGILQGFEGLFAGEGLGRFTSVLDEAGTAAAKLAPHADDAARGITSIFTGVSSLRGGITTLLGGAGPLGWPLTVAINLVTVAVKNWNDVSKSLIESLTYIADSVGKNIMPPIRELIAGIGERLGPAIMTVMVIFAAIDEVIQTVIEVIGRLIGQLGPILGPAIDFITASIGGWIAITKDLLFILLDLLGFKWDKVGKDAQKLFEDVSTYGGRMVDAAKRFFQNLGPTIVDAISSIGETLGPKLTAIWEFIQTTILPKAEKVIAAAGTWARETLVPALLGALSNLGTLIGEGLEAANAAFTMDNLMRLMVKIADAQGTVLKWLQDNVWPVVRDSLGSFFTWLGDTALPAIGNFMGDNWWKIILAPMLIPFAAGLGLVWIRENIGPKFIEAIQGLFTWIGSLDGSAVGAVGGILFKLLFFPFFLAGALGKFISDFVIPQVVEALKNIGTAISTWFTTDLPEFGRAGLEALKGKISDGFIAVKDFVSGFMGSPSAGGNTTTLSGVIVGPFLDVIGWITTTFFSEGDGFIGKIKNGLTTTRDGIRDLVGTVLAGGQLSEIGDETILGKLANPLIRLINWVASTFFGTDGLGARFKAGLTTARDTIMGVVGVMGAGGTLAKMGDDTILGKLINPLIDLMNWVSNTFFSPTGFRKKFEDGLADLRDKGFVIFGNFIEGKGLSEIDDNTILGKIVNPFIRVLNWVSTTFFGEDKEDKEGGMLGRMKWGWNQVKSIITGVIGSNENEGIWAIFTQFKQKAIDPVVTAMSSLWDKLQNFPGIPGPLQSLMNLVGRLFGGSGGAGGGAPASGGSGGGTAKSSAAGPHQGPWGYEQGPGGQFSHKSLNAIDLSMPNGTPLYAIGGGQVIESGYGGAIGNYLDLRTNAGNVFRYGHLTSMLEAGSSVAEGQQIGTSGNTGTFTTGPHLHFEHRSGPDYDFTPYPDGDGSIYKFVTGGNYIGPDVEGMRMNGTSVDPSTEEYRFPEEDAAAEVEIPKDKYIFPVDGYQGPVPLHWGKGKGSADLFAPMGTTIRAMTNGRVSGGGTDGLGGNTIMIKGDDGLDYYYAHMVDAPRQRAGDRVSAGDVLGGVGKTGNAASTDPHLHLGIGHGIKSGPNYPGEESGGGFNFDAHAFLNEVLSTGFVAPSTFSGGTSGGANGATGLAGTLLGEARKYFRYLFGGDEYDANGIIFPTSGGTNNPTPGTYDPKQWGDPAPSLLNSIMGSRGKVTGMGDYITSLARSLGIPAAMQMTIFEHESGFLSPRDGLYPYNNPSGLTGRGWPGQTGNTPPGMFPREFATFNDIANGVLASVQNMASDMYKNLTVRRFLAQWLTGSPDKAGDPEGFTVADYVSNFNSMASRLNLSINPENAIVSSYADGKWEVPGDMLANIHKGEMVVPADFAGELRAAMAAAPTFSSAGALAVLNSQGNRVSSAMSAQMAQPQVHVVEKEVHEYHLHVDGTAEARNPEDNGRLLKRMAYVRGR